MPGLLRGVVRTAAVAGTATAVSNRVSRRQGQRWAQQEAEPQPAYQQQAPPAPSPAAEDPVAQLEKLADLRDRGILTDAEFTAQKTKILGM
jgi:hypothetical protein